MLDELDSVRHNDYEQAEMSASRAKIVLQETVEAEEFGKEKWTRLKGRLIVSCERLQERLGNAVSCRLCQGHVNTIYGKRTTYRRHTTGSPSSLYKPHKEHNTASNHKCLHGIFNKISKEVVKSETSIIKKVSLFSLAVLFFPFSNFTLL